MYDISYFELLAPQSGAHRRDADRDFDPSHPFHLKLLPPNQMSMVTNWLLNLKVLARSKTKGDREIIQLPKNPVWCLQMNVKSCHITPLTSHPCQFSGGKSNQGWQY